MIFFNKKQVAPKDLVDRLLWSAQSWVDSAGAAIPNNLAADNLEYVVRNSGCAIEYLIQRVALFQRAKHDTAQARIELARIPAFLDHIDEAIIKAQKKGLSDDNFVYVSNLGYPYVGALLSGDWGRAERLARSSLLKVVIDSADHGASPHDEMPRMLAAVFLDDARQFAHHCKRYAEGCGFDRFFKVYFRYEALLEAIIKRDATAFNDALQKQESLFVDRAKDRKVDHPQALDGMLENNERVFDVWAVAIAGLAHHRGIHVTYSSEIMPTEMFR
jgi:hypothetical protein